MKPFDKIIEDYQTEEGVDLRAVIAAAEKEMGDWPVITGDAQLRMLDEHLTWCVKYLGGILLQTADELGALPDGFEDAYGSLLLALEFNKFRLVYNLKASAKSKLEVVGQTNLEIV